MGIIKGALLIILITGNIMGGITGVFESRIRRGCSYETLASRIVPFYFISCELFKKRFKEVK